MDRVQSPGPARPGDTANQRAARGNGVGRALGVEHSECPLRFFFSISRRPAGVEWQARGDQEQRGEPLVAQRLQAFGLGAEWHRR